MQRRIGIAAGRESIFVERKEGELELQPWGKERRRGAHLMEGGEEMGCTCSGACVRERGGDEGGFIAAAAACELANEESKTKEIKEVLSKEN
jgi:DNA-binding IclR family transcriptional regulator